MRKYNCVKSTKVLSDTRGLTLVEMIVAVAVLAIVAAMLVATFTNSFEDQRRNADMSTLNNIDSSLMQILLDDDVFAEINHNKGSVIYDNNKMHLVFSVNENEDTKKGEILLSETKLNGNALRLETSCPTLYKYLVEYIGDEIHLTSSTYRRGTYIVNVTFNGTLVSGVRDYTLANDNVIITNSDDEYLYQHE